MKIKIWQIDLDRDSDGVAFESFDSMLKYSQIGLDHTIYDMVWEGEVKATTLEDVYKIFNYSVPNDYTGRSLSVSDIVEVIDGEQYSFHYVDSVGFTEVEFERR